jgi:two-component system OmpR family response regulator
MYIRVAGVEQARTQTRVLVVDDDPEQLELLTLIFQFATYQVTTSRSELEALAAIETSHPDVIVIDLVRDEGDSRDFARRLRQNGVRTPILVLSASYQLDVWSAEPGAEAYLAKPYDIDDCIAAVERLCAYYSDRPQPA